jgi:endoglucanase
MADGHQVGGVQTATASHTAGQWQTVTLTGDFGANGPSQVQVNYINDASGGTASTDRNLYVQGIEVNGHHFDGTNATNTASLGYTDPNAADMLANGTLTFATAGSTPTVHDPLWH